MSAHGAENFNLLEIDIQTWAYCYALWLLIIDIACYLVDALLNSVMTVNFVYEIQKIHARFRLCSIEFPQGSTPDFIF